MKKKIIITALSLMIASSTIIPAYAAEPMKWHIDPSTYEDYSWWTAMESLEATKIWAEGYRAQLESIPDNMGKFSAIATIVTDFLSYDLDYRTLIDTYTYRDGKGVCEDYARSVMALCQVAGLPCTYETGHAYGDGHAWNKVTIDGVDYYSDLTGYEGSGDKSLWLSTTLWSDHEYQASLSEMDVNTVANSFNCTYTDGGNIPDPGSNLVKMIGRSGKQVFVTEDDAAAFRNDLITVEQLIAKYPDLG